jgi:hypothetical protein
MHKRGGLKRLARRLHRHLVPGDSAQFLVDLWQQSLCALRVAVVYRRQ